MNKIKYPRTPHLPWSPGATADDLHTLDTHHFDDRDVIVTEKMDGENTTMYRDAIHARSVDSRHHPSRNWVKKLHAELCHEIPNGWRLSGENLYAQHSLAYTGLESYFYLFSVWNNENICLSRAETAEWAGLLNLPTPRVLYAGVWGVDRIKAIEVDEQMMEGYVVRKAECFTYADFHSWVAKWVRPHHVQTDQHWMHKAVIPNGLTSNNS